MIALGIIIGFIVGALALGWAGGLAGGFVGFIVALAWRSRSQARERMQRAALPTSPLAQPSSRPAPPPMSYGDASPSETLRRLAAIERRLETLERHAGIEPQAAVEAEFPLPSVPPPPVTSPVDAPLATTSPWAAGAAPQSRATVPATEPPTPAGGELPGLVRAADGTLAAVGLGASAKAVVPPPVVPVPQPAPVNPLWAWFIGGNTLTRIGVIVLFLGVAFLLKYFADFVTIPIEVKLLGVALAGGALIALGAWLARTRPGYGVSLEGAGAGILYLTTFAAYRYYDVLPAVPAFVFLIAVTVLTVGLAVREDSQPLAGLAIAGGFLAPFLVATSPGAPARLFAYFAVLNAAIFVLAWFRAWRALNALGFVFTFALGLFWGERFYQPAYFATVEPFLVLFFVFYVTIAILYAKRGPLQAKAPVDALLVFGVPLMGFALQANLVYDMRYGVALSALCVAGVYGVLAAVLFRRPEPGLSLLARAFFALAVIFGTIAIPFAADPRWTTGWWALEGAAVYWIGCRQRQGLARAFALLVQAGAAVAFIAGGFDEGERLFLNATFLGTTMIALAALTTAWVADRHRETISGNERALVPLLVIWGLAWWYGGGALELVRALPAREEANAVLAYVVGSTAGALLLRRWLQWSRLAWFGAVLLPVMAIVAFADWERMRTSLLVYGWLIWPLAWATHWRVLRAADALRGDDGVAGAPVGWVAGFLKHAHTASAIAAVAWVAWEASEWVGRAFPEGTVWMPCAAAWPAILYLALIARTSEWRGWPFTLYRDAYATSAATTIAALLGVWFVLVNAISPGGTAPLPYAPLANPLDVTLIASLAAVFVWARGTLRVAERALYGWWGAAVFLLLNAIVFRSVHQWLDVPWRLSALLASKSLQAALTLTWTATALPLMLLAGKRAIRPLWMVGAGLLAIVVVKLFLVDLGALSGLSRVVAFLGVGVLLLVIGYLAPLPPSAVAKSDSP
jgi:uncharacterized membrane protein